MGIEDMALFLSHCSHCLDFLLLNNSYGANYEILSLITLMCDLASCFCCGLHTGHRRRRRKDDHCFTTLDLLISHLIGTHFSAVNFRFGSTHAVTYAADEGVLNRSNGAILTKWCQASSLMHLILLLHLLFS